MSVDDFLTHKTLDSIPDEWWSLGQLVSRGILTAGTRVGLGLTSVGFAVAGAMLFGSDAGVPYGKAALGVAVLTAMTLAWGAATSGARTR